MDFAVPADRRVKLKESEKKNKYLDLAREWKNLWNMKMTSIPIVIGAFGTVTKGLLKGLEDLKIRGCVEDHPNYNVIENGQNTEKSPGDLRRLPVTQTPGKNDQLKLMWKNSQGVNDNNCSSSYSLRTLHKTRQKTLKKSNAHTHTHTHTHIYIYLLCIIYDKIKWPADVHRSIDIFNKSLSEVDQCIWMNWSVVTNRHSLI